ncbi:MAG: cytochrome P450, partial [Anaerolineae bacterium]|nr:cytochrome P450 [Anaerolineae bacterium]
MNHIPQVNITSPEFKADPYPFYARLRAEAPIYRTILPDKQPAWLVTRFDDVMMVLKDEERFVKNRLTVMSPEQLKKLPWVPPMLKPYARNLLDLDGADHDRLRSLVHKAFTPRLVEQMRQRVQTLAHELLDKVESRGRMDLIADYALPIPLTIISEILGIPARDQGKFHRWTKGIIELTASNSMVWGIYYLIAITRYLRRIFDEKRLRPQDDLITALVQAEEAGDHLSQDELLAMVFVLLVAGH